MAAWPEIIEAADTGCPCDYVLFNNVQELDPAPPRPPSDYDFQLVHIPLRSVVPEAAYFAPISTSTEAYDALFEEARLRLAQFLQSAMRWNVEHGLLTFVFNYLVPQQNPMGRLLPRYHLSNFSYFVERLNEALADEIKSYTNTYFFDFDQVVSTYGRRYFQDDVLWQFNHNAALTDLDGEFDGNRLEAAGTAREHYPLRTQEYLQSAWRELLAMYRTITRADTVKLVITDLDDTLWRGVAAEQSGLPDHAREGWPRGFVEALGYLKRRGILLAIVSKNDEAAIERLWPALVGNHLLSLNDFVIRRINWLPKAENVGEVLQLANILPHNAVFIDDNPAERAAVKHAYPDIRVIGPTPLLWRRILLWSAETQVAIMTPESGRRTEMTRAQVERELQRVKVSRAELLESLDLKVGITELAGTPDPRFARALELLNKTNQYNTTGQRWSESECVAALAAGARFFVFDALDRFTDYGIVGLVITDGRTISQFVMSCRVVGMEIENAVLAHVIATIGRGNIVAGRIEETQFNGPARKLFAETGFTFDGKAWRLAVDAEIRFPKHIRLETDHVSAK